MTMKETTFNNKQYAIIHHIHIGILGTGLLLGDVKIWRRVTVIDYAALFQNISFLLEYACRLATSNGIVQAGSFYPNPYCGSCCGMSLQISTVHEIKLPCLGI